MTLNHIGILKPFITPMQSKAHDMSCALYPWWWIPIEQVHTYYNRTVTKILSNKPFQTLTKVIGTSFRTRMCNSEWGHTHLDHLNHPGRVTLSQDWVCTLSNVACFLHLLQTKLDIQGGKVLVQILDKQCVSTTVSFILFFFSYLDIMRPRDGDDIWSLCEEPSERNLPCRGIVFHSNLLDFLHNLKHVW